MSGFDYLKNITYNSSIDNSLVPVDSSLNTTPLDLFTLNCVEQAQTLKDEVFKLAIEYVKKEFIIILLILSILFYANILFLKSNIDKDKIISLNISGLVVVIGYIIYLGIN